MEIIRIAIIGTDGRDPVVWGLGDTRNKALRDAQSQDGNKGWDALGWTSVAVSARTADEIEAGTVRCSDLGIVVRTDRDGRIISAEAAS